MFFDYLFIPYFQAAKIEGMKKTFSLALLFGAISIQAQVDLINRVKDNGSSSEDIEFTTVYDIEALEVEDQGRSGTCWSFSATGFLESECIRKGNRVDLSALYVVRKVYEEKAEKYIRLHGALNFGQGGALPDAIFVLKEHGAVPEEIYSGRPDKAQRIDHGELEDALSSLLDAVLKREGRALKSNWKEAVSGLLDAYLGPVPESFDWEGKTYTPRSFADDFLKLNADDYLQVTSFVYQPYYAPMMIEVPDNWMWGSSWNLPLDEFMSVLDASLSEGYTLAWATDVSEKGFSIRNGLAINPDREQLELLGLDDPFIAGCPEIKVSEELRQADFDAWKTTDDHGMQIVGKVTDQTGKAYYAVRNSWGDRENPYRSGHLYATESFIAHKSISLVVNVEALPARLRKKLDL